WPHGSRRAAARETCTKSKLNRAAALLTMRTGESCDAPHHEAETGGAMLLNVRPGWLRSGKKRRFGLRLVVFVLAKPMARRLGFVLADLRRLPTGQGEAGGGESAHGKFAPRAHATLVAVNCGEAPDGRHRR